MLALQSKQNPAIDIYALISEGLNERLSVAEDSKDLSLANREKIQAKVDLILRSARFAFP